MKAWQKRIIGVVSIAVLTLITVFLYLHLRMPPGSVPLRDIVSYCTGDATNDGVPELLVLSGNGETDAGERHGQFLLVCDASAEADMDSLGYLPPEKIRHRIDLSGIKPLKVQIGDINGDGIKEVAICVYKTANFHPVMAKRPFFFDLVEGDLIPVWLGSRLSRPFDDYILQDMDADNIDEILSIEQLENGKRVLAIYNWKGFGFEILTQSVDFDGELFFDTAGQRIQSGEVGAIFSSRGEQTRLKFCLIDDKLIYSVY